MAEEGRLIGRAEFEEASRALSDIGRNEGLERAGFDHESITEYASERYTDGAAWAAFLWGVLLAGEAMRTHHAGRSGETAPEER
jgi:hypothetical protein